MYGSKGEGLRGRFRALVDCVPVPSGVSALSSAAASASCRSPVTSPVSASSVGSSSGVSSSPLSYPESSSAEEGVWFVYSFPFCVSETVSVEIVDAGSDVWVAGAS